MDKKTLHEKREEFLKQQKEADERKRYHRTQFPDDYITGRRYDAKTKDKVETMPLYYHTGDMDRYLKAHKDAQAFGGPKLTPDQLTAMALVEGREDFGYNTWDTGNPKVVKYYSNLVKNGMDPHDAGFAAAIYEKDLVAKRLKIPFETAWNGTGTSIWNKSGKNYSDTVNKTKEAVKHPKNETLYNFIKQRASNEDDIPDVAVADAVEMPQDYSDGNWKLI
jgi:hypothetical protein